MVVYNYDVVILGMGLVGEGVVMNVFKYGCKLVVVDSCCVVGGNCMYFGIIFFKVLCYLVKQIIEFNINLMFCQIGELCWFFFFDVLKSVDWVIFKQVVLCIGYYVCNCIDMFIGIVSFVDECIVEVVMLSGVVECLVVDQFVIVIGLCLYCFLDINFNYLWVYDSDIILFLSYILCWLIIYGVGVIGCEYVLIFSGLGVLVDLIDMCDQLFSFFDDEIFDVLSYYLCNNNVLICYNEEYECVEGLDNGVILYLKLGKKIKVDVLFWCNGWIGNIDKFGLENVGIKVNSCGQIEVDENYCILVSNIFVVGDVIGWLSLVSVVYDQGCLVVGNIVESDSWCFVNDVLIGIYIILEISLIGKNESELIVVKIFYEVGKVFFKGMVWVQIFNELVGMLKILFYCEILEIFGVYCFGDQVLEIVYIGQVIMNQLGELNILKYFVNIIFNYLIMVEVYWVVVFDGFNWFF